VSLHLRRYARFQLVGPVGVATDGALARVGDYYRWPFAVAVLATILIIPRFSFLLHRTCTFAFSRGGN
jgi:putative flippase GtrA